MNPPFDCTNIVIETPRLILRAFTAQDLDDMYEYASVPGVGEAAGWPHHKNIEETQNILNMFMEEKNVFALWHRADKKVIGSLGLHESWTTKDKCPTYGHLSAKEMGYVLAKPYWGQGLATEAARAALDFCREKLRLECVGICHFRENAASRRVIEKLGFSYVKEDTYYSKQMDTHFPDIKYVLVF
jgi:ribosomal-protein-alanine N-acetyltransferase